MKTTNQEVKTENLKKGTWFARVSYCRVEDVNIMGDLKIRNEFGKSWGITDGILDQELIYSADYFTEEVEVSRTEMIKALKEAGDAVFTCSFYTKPKDKDIVDTVKSFNAGQITPTKNMISQMNNTLKGHKRTVVGYTMGTTDFGYTLAIDLNKKLDTEANHDNRVISINHNTIEELILKGTKYILK